MAVTTNFAGETVLCIWPSGDRIPAPFDPDHAYADPYQQPLGPLTRSKSSVRAPQESLAWEPWGVALSP